MEKRYQIFVSSTYSDLQSQREHVIHNLNKIGYIAVGMEQFPSTSETQMEYIRKVIDESDYYVVIIRGKYGSTDINGASFTESEFNYAAKIGIPCLAFLFKDIASIKLSDTDQDPIKYKKLIEFRSNLEQSRIVSYWSNDHDLASLVKDSINDIVRRRPGVGYVRASQIIDANIVNERERLLRENIELKNQIKIINEEIRDTSSENMDMFKNEIIQTKFTYIATPTFEFMEDGTISQRNNPPIDVDVKISILDSFFSIANIMENEIEESEIIYKFAIDLTQNNLPDNAHIYNLNMESLPSIAQNLRLKLEAMGLISINQRSVEERSGTFDKPYRHRRRLIEWLVTKRGRKLLVDRLVPANPMSQNE